MSKRTYGPWEDEARWHGQKRARNDLEREVLHSEKKALLGRSIYALLDEIRQDVRTPTIPS